MLSNNSSMKIRISSKESFVEFPRGNTIKIVLANTYARGYRFNGMIIDSTVNTEVKDVIIMPHLVPIYDENNMYSHNDNPVERVYTVDISKDDVIHAKEYAHSLSKQGESLTEECLSEKLINAISKNWNKESFAKAIENIKLEDFGNMFATSTKYVNGFDAPHIEKELNNNKTLVYLAMGIPEENITYETEFVNKTKQTYLNINGEVNMEGLGFKNKIRVHLHIDTNIYDGYDVCIEDGLVFVRLHEIKNEAPVLKDYGVV